LSFKPVRSRSQKTPKTEVFGEQSNINDPITAMKESLLKYYPVLLAFVSFIFSVSLWFTGNQLEGIFVGIWVPSILSLSAVLNQIRENDRKDQL
jgi:hypothetical protein